METVKLNYWAGHKNFGDELSPYLIKKITNKKIIHANQKEINKLIALGSIIDFNNIYSKSHIWGSGVLAEDFINPHRLLPLNKIFRKNYYRSKIHATRGPLSRKILTDLGFTCPEIYGDPGIIVRHFYTPQHQIKKYRIGIIFHQTHQKLIDDNLELLNNEGIKIISINREGDSEVENFIDVLHSCHSIFSTSLHGIVIAQAYGIPFQWLKIKHTSIHRDEEFKFKDYFLGINTPPQPPLIIEKINKSTIESMKKFNFQSNNIPDYRTILEAFPKEFL